VAWGKRSDLFGHLEGRAAAWLEATHLARRGSAPNRPVFRNNRKQCKAGKGLCRPSRSPARVRTHDWKLIWKHKGAEKELYHLAADRQQRKNLACERPYMVREVEGLLLGHRQQAAHTQAATTSHAAAATAEAEEATIAKRLGDLGHL
jgi:hypothetical protein